MEREREGSGGKGEGRKGGNRRAREGTEGDGMDGGRGESMGGSIILGKGQLKRGQMPGHFYGLWTKPASINYGRPCIFLRESCMDQDATWYRGVGVGPGDIVLDGDPFPHRKGTATDHVSAHDSCGQMAGGIKTPLGS